MASGSESEARLSPWVPVEEGGEAVDLTTWKSVSIDGSASTVVATGTFFVVPLATAGRLEGTYEYRLGAKIL
ncbi:MAG: hypothetical protein ACKV2T_15750 [Kofleriaceae bacterium]